MTALAFLERQNRRGLASFLEAVRSVPEEKIGWKPAPGARSALDLLQEVATITDLVPDLYETRKLEFTPEMGETMERRMREVSDVPTLIRMVEEATERELGRLRTVPVENYGLSVEMPWMEDTEIVDIMNYHVWNMAYHEGQINYIASLLADGTDVVADTSA